MPQDLPSQQNVLSARLLYPIVVWIVVATIYVAAQILESREFERGDVSKKELEPDRPIRIVDRQLEVDNSCRVTCTGNS